MASSLKRILETNEDLSNKRVKICTEIGHFYEVQSNKNVITVGRNSSDYWKSSYQRYFLSYYGGYRGRKRCVKNKIGSKKKVVDGLEENIENADFVKSKISLFGNRPLDRRRSTKDSRSVISIKLKLLLRKMAMLLSSFGRQ